MLTQENFAMGVLAFCCSTIIACLAYIVISLSVMALDEIREWRHRRMLQKDLDASTRDAMDRRVMSSIHRPMWK